MPINNALTPQGQNALGAAFGYYPQLRRNRRSQDPQAALDMPVQFLRGRLASTLGMPSDVLNTLQSPLPMEVYGDVDYSAAQQVPYGTQDLLQQLPLAPTGPAQQAAANLGSVVPMTPMEALQAARLARQAALAGGQAVASTGRALAPVAGDMLTNYMVKRNMILPLDVYHGTPHKLPPTASNPLGEFDASKIGTGAGAQAYGHGIYVSESSPYADTFALRRNIPDIEGIAFQNGLQLSRNAQVELIRQATRDSMGKPTKAENYIDPVAAVKKLQNANIEVRQMPADKLRDTIREVQEQNKAYLYKADLPDEMIAKMLDWDKPLSQQPNILEILGKNYRSDYLNMFKDKPGKDFYKAISGNSGIEDLRISGSSELTKLGIPGIKYKNADARNFVTFPGEEKSIKILERQAR